METIEKMITFNNLTLDDCLDIILNINMISADRRQVRINI